MQVDNKREVTPGMTDDEGGEDSFLCLPDNNDPLSLLLVMMMLSKVGDPNPADLVLHQRYLFQGREILWVHHYEKNRYERKINE